MLKGEPMLLCGEAEGGSTPFVGGVGESLESMLRSEKTRP